MSISGSWAYSGDSDDVIELTDAGVALHLLKSVFFLNGKRKTHWNSVKHPRDGSGRWAHTFGSNDPSVTRTRRIYGNTRDSNIGGANRTINPGDRVYQTSGGSHVVVRPDGTGTLMTSDGRNIDLTGRGVDSHMGARGSHKPGKEPKLVDSQPGIEVNAKDDDEAEKVLQQHEGIDKKYADKHPEALANYKPKHSSTEPDAKSEVPEKEDSNDFSSMDLQPGDELRRNAKDNNQTLVLHTDGSSKLFDAKTGKETTNNVNKTQGLLMDNSDVAEALAGKKAWSTLDARGISSSQKTIDTRWPIIHKEPMKDSTFEHPEHGSISAKYSDSKNIVAKEHPKGIAVRNTHTGSTLLHKKDGTVSKFSGSVNDFNSLPDARSKKSIEKANEKTHSNDKLGGTTPTNIGSDPNQKNSFRQNQQATGHGIKQDTLGGVDSTGDLKLPSSDGKSDSIVIENEAELNIIMKTFQQLGIKTINGVPLEEYFNVKGKNK